MKYLLVVVLLFVAPVALSADFLIMHGSSGKIYDKVVSDNAYAIEHNIDIATAPADIIKPFLAAEKILATVTDLGVDPTNTAKLNALGAMADFVACIDYNTDPTADLEDAPSCFVKFEDTSIAADACQTLTACAVPGAQLCNILDREHVLVKRDLAGTICLSTCKDPSIKLRVVCQ